MLGKPRAFIALVATVCAVASIAFVNAVPAYAKDTVMCNSDRSGDGPPENQKLIPTPKGDYVKITINLCVARVDKNSQRGAKAREIDWRGSQPYKRFNYFKLTVRLEHDERTVKSHTCDLAPAINRYRFNLKQYTCLAGWISHAGKYKWTADGVVHYDIYGDGKGDMVWQLRGSPEIA
jgi:hypothetical protein